MADELLVVLNRNENTGFGFSLLGKPGLPPIIYNILEDSPAAESGEVEVGDVILKVNETDVNRFSTKEVLKCLRLSSDPVTLKIKRDPKIKATLRKHLLSTTSGNNDSESENRNSKSSSNRNNIRPGPAVHQNLSKTNGSCATPSEQEPLLNENERLLWEPLAASASETNAERNKTQPQQPKFEAYMMTGEHILNISKMPPQQQNLMVANFIIPKQQKKMDSMRYHNSHTHHLRHQSQPPVPPPPASSLHSNSLPASPNEADLGHKLQSSNSAHTSPIASPHTTPSPSSDQSAAKPPLNNPLTMVRTSRSEDQLQDESAYCDKPAHFLTADDLDEDVTSSLNTLLDTREGSESDRIVWTYNAPPTSSSQSTSSSTSSPMRGNSSASPSPTSVSSSVMSSSQSSGVSRRFAPIANAVNGNNNNGGDCFSEALSNISSPDYHDDETSMMQMAGIALTMECSDHSDSDSTLLVSEQSTRRKQKRGKEGGGDHRIVIQVKGPDKDCVKDRGKGDGGRSKLGNIGYQLSNESGDGIFDYDQDQIEKAPSPQSSEDESDIESLHSFHYSPKAVDLPSAIRLAKRLYSLDGFKKSDVSRHLSKNNDFSRAVAEEYLKYFEFKNETLDAALRKFLKQFSLTGETQERERVLVHFSKRFLDCNPGAFNSQDAVHTLTCAIMLLNTDLHGQNMNRKMACNEFIMNLAGLNEGDNFPTEVLKQLYHAIKKHPLEWALDEEIEDGSGQIPMKPSDQMSLGANPFLDVPTSANAVEYKKGYVMRKCCYEANAKKTPFHKRSWKMFYCTLRDLVLYLHKDENGFRKNQMGDNLNNAIRIHHALATKATDYTKKLFVFRLQTADQAEYLFQTTDSKELQSWIDTINFVCASFSAQPLEGGVGSQKKFVRPLLPCSHTKLNLRDQLRDHEERVHRLETELDEHRRTPPEKNAKSLVVQNYKEKEAYFNYELKRYRTYVYVLRTKMCQYPGEMAGAISLAESSIGEVDEASGVTIADSSVVATQIVPPPIPHRPSPTTNRRRCPE